MKTLTLKFPYLHEANKNGILFADDTLSILTNLINIYHNRIPVVYHMTRTDYDYAIGSSVRYATVDPMCVIGHIVEFDSDKEIITIEAKDEYASIITQDNIKLRALVEKFIPEKDATDKRVRTKLKTFIAIDVIQPTEEDKS